MCHSPLPFRLEINQNEHFHDIFLQQTQCLAKLSIFGDLFHPQSKFFINNTPEGVSGYDVVCQSLSNGLAVIESRP